MVGRLHLQTRRTTRVRFHRNLAIIAFVVLRVREFRREAAANAARDGAPHSHRAPR